MTDRLDRRSHTFFRDRVLPLAERTRARRRRRLPTGPDPSAASYYEPARRPCMERADFVRASGLGPETLEAKLRELWQERGDAELAELAPELARLARGLAIEVAEEGDEISPFVYVMY
jgi:hypothetical protein